MQASLFYLTATFRKYLKSVWAESVGRSTLRFVFTGRVLGRNLLIALIVCCVLSLANQFDVILNGPFQFRLGLKLLCNFLIPFAVSSISAVINREAAR
jgi:hypothetical protein